MKGSKLLLLLVIIMVKKVNSWHESSKCTITQTDSSSNNNNNNNNNSNEQDELNLTTAVEAVGARNSLNEENILKLSCQNNNLIFIAWSHYGKHQSQSSNIINNINQTETENCYFSPKDCTVNVDYVANECNGLNSCQISLDSQYLHSCKSYSDYLFIIYDCIEAKSTVNVCDSNTSITSLASTYDTIYLQSPNYPLEYSNNLDCNCTMRTQYSNSVEFEFLEFDLESTSSTNSFNLINEQTCTKDYLNISSSKLCGTLSPFVNLKSNKTKQDTLETNFRFYSDDALTRRGFWIKVKSSAYSTCPDNNFILIENSCIRIYNDIPPLTWYEAQNYCSQKGYSLAIIDNFEMDKQINKALFSQSSSQLKKFWTGIRHLNETDWFDHKNELIKFKKDEYKWWPWLAVDTSTYNTGGSCLGKRQNWLFLEDCYKKMPFACQTKPKTKSVNPSAKSNPRIQLKCDGNNLPNLASTLSPLPSNFPFLKIEAKPIQVSNNNPIILTTSPLAVVITNLNDTNYVVNTKTSLTSNSTLLVCLISSITLLIAFINSIVILVICRRRKLLLHKNSEKKLSKTKNHDTMSSGGSSSSSSGAGEITSSAGTDSSSSLTFSTRNIHLISNNGGTAANIADANRRSIFLNKQQINRNDPLGHIYETISVGSSTASHSNLTNSHHFMLSNPSRFAINTNNSSSNLNSNYNLFNHYHLHTNSNDYCGAAVTTTNNEASLCDSANSQEFFIQNKKKFHTVTAPPANCFRPIMVRNEPCFSEFLNQTNSSTSPSCSLTTTTTTTLNDLHQPNTFTNNNNNNNNNKHLVFMPSSNDIKPHTTNQYHVNNHSNMIQTLIARNSFRNNFNNQFLTVMPQQQHQQHQHHHQQQPLHQYNPSINQSSLNFLSNNPVEAIV